MYKYLIVPLSICFGSSCSISLNEDHEETFTLQFEETKKIGNIEITIDSIADTRCNIGAFNGSPLVHIHLAENGTKKEFYLE